MKNQVSQMPTVSWQITPSVGKDGPTVTVRLEAGPSNAWFLLSPAEARQFADTLRAEAAWADDHWERS